MEKKKIPTYLTEDLWMNILSRSPVKSIFQSKCVCKSWSTLTSHPRFINLHFNRSTLKNPNLLLRSFDPDPYFTISFDLLTYSTNFQTLDSNFLQESVPLPLDLPPLPRIQVLGSCNGLLFLSNRKTYMSILNPTTRELVPLPFLEFNDNKEIIYLFGFGWDSVNYRVVRIAFTYDCEVMVYTLGTNSWRMVDDTPSTTCLIDNVNGGVHVNGVLHWKGGGGGELSVPIVSFCLRTEKFGEVARPCSGEGHDELGVWDGCLAMFCHFGNECFDIWVMKDYGMKDSWVRVFSVGRTTIDFDLLTLYPILKKKNGEILLHTRRDNLILYDPVRKRARVVNVRGAPNRFTLSTYVEALTPLSSLMSGNQLEGE